MPRQYNIRVTDERASEVLRAAKAFGFGSETSVVQDVFDEFFESWRAMQEDIKVVKDRAKQPVASAPRKTGSK